MGPHKYYCLTLETGFSALLLFHLLDRPLTLCSNPNQEMLLTRRAVNLSWPKPVLCCAAHTAWLLCVSCTAQTPWLQDQVSQLILVEEPAGSSHLPPAIMPPAWPCLYPTVQQELLTRTSFLLDRRNDEQSCILLRKPYTSSKD